MLGLAEDEIVSMYDRSKQQLGEPSLVPKSRLEMAPVRGKSRWPWVVGGAVTFFMAAGLIAYLSEHGLPWTGTNPDEATAPVLQEVPATTTQAPAAAAGSTPVAEPTTAQPAGPAPFLRTRPPPRTLARRQGRRNPLRRPRLVQTRRHRWRCNPARSACN